MNTESRWMAEMRTVVFTAIEHRQQQGFIYPPDAVERAMKSIEGMGQAHKDTAVDAIAAILQRFEGGPFPWSHLSGRTVAKKSAAI